MKNENEHAGESLLEVFYKDRKRWSYTFQSCALLSRYQNIENAIKKQLLLHNNENESSNVNNLESVKSIKNEIFITERCLDTDFFVFTKMLRDEKSIDSMEYEIYNRLYSHLKLNSSKLHGIVHVSTDSEECSRRIFSRSRIGENNIPLEYLLNLDKSQNEWINSCDIPILKSDNNDFILTKIKSFIDDVLAIQDKEKA